MTFTKLYSTVDGKESNMNFNKLSLGSIAPGQNIMARWWYTCNVMAHVANYEVQMTKHSNYGMEFDLITIDGVRELTHSVGGTLAATPGGSPTDASIFLLNTIQDENNLPDRLMDSSGNETDDLQIVSSQMTTAPATSESRSLSSVVRASSAATAFTLTVQADRAGWVYGRVQDPTNCRMTLVKAVRQSDGADVTQNLWQTERTVQQDYTIIVDNRLHIADCLTALNGSAAETYTLYYEPKPAAAPTVKSITLIADEGQEQSKATKARVLFDEAIDTGSLSGDDVVLIMAGKELPVTVEAESPTAAIIDWTASLSSVAGTASAADCTLTVFTSGITNAEGTAGTSNKSISWTATVPCILGDVNGDGEVTAQDASLIQQYVARKFDNAAGNGFAVAAADVNGDGEVTAQDASLVQQYVARKISW